MSEKQAKSKKSKGWKIGRYVVNVLDGSFLTKENVLNNVPFMGFLFLIAIVYISNSYYAEKNLRNSAKLNRELKELKSEFISTRSELMFVSKQSEVAKAVNSIGLYESVAPPKKIVVEPEQLER
jgi:hypothetical protein